MKPFLVGLIMGVPCGVIGAVVGAGLGLHVSGIILLTMLNYFAIAVPSMLAGMRLE